MPTPEKIHIEAVFMTGSPDVADFQGRVTEHHVPRDPVKVGAGGDTEISMRAGEYAIIADVPAGFDIRKGWNRAEIASLGGWREIIGTSSEGPGTIRINLKRRYPNP